MNSIKSIIISIIVVAVVVFGIYAFSPRATDNNIEDNNIESESTNNASDATVVENSVPTSGQEVQPRVATTATTPITKGGTYEPYAAEKLARANTGKVVLFFRASWCPTCQAVDADIRSKANSIPDNVTILDVNYDASTDLKRKYGVTYQHTFVQVDASGNQITKWSGSSTLASLLAKIN